MWALLPPPGPSLKCFSVFAGPSAGPGPSSEQSNGGTDRRGRQKITWQPPTASQKESDAQVHIFTMSLFKAALLGCLCWRWSVLSLLLMHILTLHALHGTRTCTLSIQKQCSQLKWQHPARCTKASVEPQPFCKGDTLRLRIPLCSTVLRAAD